ncbi:Fur family transcriptional regulator [uncultured Bacteroides sp.]|uniref:Fur family transcriptional regulator n=1 Tax=uncultured Bacteroides sp. TaxID=162156 RepID=UPI003748A7AC
MNVTEHLLKHQIKPSVQRIAIMQYLLDHKTHPSVDEIHAAISLYIPTLSKTTVYNTLKLFADQDAAQMLTIDERRVCFDGDATPHSHFLCKKCGSIYDFFFQESAKDVMPQEVNGHEITEIHYYYKGFCKNCLNHND